MDASHKAALATDGGPGIDHRSALHLQRLDLTDADTTAASKGALAELTRSPAATFAGQRARVHALRPVDSGFSVA